MASLTGLERVQKEKECFILAAHCKSVPKCHTMCHVQRRSKIRIGAIIQRTTPQVSVAV